MPATDDHDPLEAALDELYGVEPGDFVVTRKRLVTDLRASDAPGAAKRLANARRPTTAAWALNQLRRREPERLDAFLARSRDLRVAGREEMRTALAEQREAFVSVTDAALGLLGTRANDGYRAQITATLHAATADESVAARLEQGRLTHEIADLAFPSGPVDEPGDQRGGEPGRDAQAAVREAETALREAERAADAAADELDAARHLLEQRTAELELARQDERAASERARQARRDVERLAASRRRLESRSRVGSLDARERG